jgi:hypothetical protein
MFVLPRSVKVRDDISFRYPCSAGQSYLTADMIQGGTVSSSTTGLSVHCSANIKPASLIVTDTPLDWIFPSGREHFLLNTVVGDKRHQTPLRPGSPACKQYIPRTS